MSIVTWDRPHFKHSEPTRKRLKGRKLRTEARVKQQVRADCEARDGNCLVLTRLGIVGQCEGESTWAHFAGHRRSQTRGMAPELRHMTWFSGMLCTKHHAQEEAGTWQVVYLTADYADGAILWMPK